MKIKYQIFKEKACLVQKYFGEWSTEYYKNYVKTLVKEQELKYVKKVFYDFREANLELVNNDLDYILQLENEVLRKDCFHVLLVESPVSTASIHLYKNELLKKGVYCNYCSTLEHALKLLLLDENIHEMEEILKNLKN